MFPSSRPTGSLRSSFYRFTFAQTLAACLLALPLLLLSGCGIGQSAAATADPATAANTMGGILHGGPNPIVGATITFYTTSNAGYGATATALETTTTDGNGFFTFPAYTTGVQCPAGSYAYIGAYSGSTGTSSTNANSLLMVPIGLCDTNFTSTNTAGVYTNTYNGQALWLDELSTVASAYALGNFMTVTSAGAINIGAPPANVNTPSTTTPSAAGLGHAFANALTLVNNHSGQPNAYTNGGTSVATGGVIPDAEIFLLGNILQGCVNSNGVTGTNTATSNDGSGCGKLFSLTTPPQAGAAVPSNTLQAMVNLAKYPNPSVNTWNAACTAAGAGTTTATSCLFGIAAPSGAYVGALTSAPPDWALAVVYGAGYGAQTTGCATTCPGFVYPYYVALDYADNVYVLNYSASATTYTSLIGLGNSGAPIFASAQDTADLTIFTIGTDTAGHVFGVNEAASGAALKVYSATSGALLTSVTGLGASEEYAIADPLNNIYMASAQAAINIRKATYTTGPSYAISSLTTTAPASAVTQIGFGTNLDLYFSTTAPAVSILANTSTYTKGAPTTPTYTANALMTTAITGNTNNGYGLAGTSTGGAIAFDSAGATPINKTGTGATTAISASTPTALPTVYNSTLYSRGVVVDGANFAISPDGANGSAVTGVSVFDSADSLALGTYKGCYVISKVCGTTAGSSPMYSPRAAVIDSSGDIWVVSGASANLTELIGSGNPTWPGLSLGLHGLPQ